MRTRALLVALVVLVALSMAAWAEGGQEAGAAAESPIDWNAPQMAVDRITGEEWIPPEGWEEATEGVEELFYFNSGAMRHDPATQENINIFEDKTGITVTWAEVSSEILFQKTLNVLVSKDPSVHGMSLDSGPYQFEQVIGAGWAEQLPYWTDEVKAAYPDAMVPALSDDEGNVYATVDTMRSYLLFYRPSWLEAAGVDPESLTTWQGVREAAQQAGEWAQENMGQDFHGIVFPAKSYNLMHMLQSGIYSQGDRVIESDGTPVYDDAAGRNSWEYWVNLVRDGIAPEDVLGWTWNDYQEVYARGKAAIMLGFSTYVNRSADPELSPALHEDVMGNSVDAPGDWAVIAPPKWDADEPETNRAAFIDFDGFMVNTFADARHKAAMMLFSEFRMSAQAMANEVVIEGNESFYPGVYDWDKVQNEILFPEPRAQSVSTTVMETFPPGAIQANDMIIEFFARSVQGDMDPLEALSQAQEQINGIYR